MREGLLRFDEVAGGVDLPPRVPEEHAPDEAVFQVVDDPFLARHAPILDYLQAGVEQTHGLVTVVEQIRIEERQVAVAALTGSRPFGCRSHGAPGGRAHAVRVVLVLYAYAA